MILSSGSKKPKIHSGAYVAPGATISGDVTIGAGCAVLHGAAIVASGSAVTIGSDTVIMENAVVRSTEKLAVKIGDGVLVGPHATLVGVTIPSGARLPPNEVRMPPGDPYGSTKALAESIRKLHAKDAVLAVHENVAPGAARHGEPDMLQAPLEADTVVDVMMVELQEMELRRKEALKKKPKQ